MVLSALGVKLLSPLPEGAPLDRLHKTKYAIGSALLALNVIPAAITYLVLMNPLPIPTTSLPSPNGYDDFDEASKLLPANPLVNSGNFDADTATDRNCNRRAMSWSPR